MKYNVLVLGASYSSLFSTKLLMAGHAVAMVCTKPTAELINREGTVVRLPIKGRESLLDISSKKLPGTLSATTPDEVNPGKFDLTVLGMQEAQYGAPGVRELMARVAQARVPCLAIMNMPPLPYLKRIPGLDTESLEACYADPGVWEGFDPGLTTLASPDPQAFRPPDQPKNVLQVGLPTNFKAARFAAEEPTALLRNLEVDIEEARFDTGDGAIEVPVKLKVHARTAPRENYGACYPRRERHRLGRRRPGTSVAAKSHRPITTILKLDDKTRLGPISNPDFEFGKQESSNFELRRW